MTQGGYQKAISSYDNVITGPAGDIMSDQLVSASSEYQDASKRTTSFLITYPKLKCGCHCHSCHSRASKDDVLHDMIDYIPIRCIDPDCRYCAEKLSHQQPGEQTRGHVGDDNLIVLHPEIAWLIAPLPHDESYWKTFEATMIDRGTMKYLAEKNVINWCRTIRTLYPVKTAGKSLI